MNTLLVTTDQKQQEFLSKMNDIIGLSFEHLTKEEYSNLRKKEEGIAYFSTSVRNSNLWCW